MQFDGDFPSEKHAPKLSLRDQLKRGFENLVKGRSHTRVKAFETTREECLRQLEKKAGLPAGDLSVIDRPPQEMVAWPLNRTGLMYGLESKTEEVWKKEGREGYICGSVTVFSKPASGASELVGDLARSSPLAASIVLKVSYEPMTVGDLHISKNCPGVYRGNECITCGNVSRD